MKTVIVAAGILAGTIFASAAQAMPVAGMPSVQAQTSRDVVTIDYPCGRGWHLNRRGVCRPNGPPPPPRWHRPPPRWDDRPGWDRRDRRPPPPPGYYRY